VTVRVNEGNVAKGAVNLHNIGHLTAYSREGSDEIINS
jgi:hypothetical protein